jgi:RNA polymerase sigma factor (sigma-70 family)
VLKLERDERLVALIRSGHDRAFEVLFDRYHSRLLAFCSSMLRSRQDAEDVLQEVFANAHAAMLADDRKIKVRPWLYRIARNRCLNHLRKPVPEGQDSMDIHPHLNGTTTAERVQDREELRQVLSDVGTLPETQRTALLLREIDQLSYDEIAVAMDTTIPAVKSLLVRARIMLAESSEARTLSCDEVRVALAEAAEGISKASGPVRLHVRDCEGCTTFRKQLRTDSKALAAIMPAGPLALLGGLFAKLFGGGGAAGGAAGGGASTSGAIGAIGGSAAAGSTATAGGLGAIGGAIGTKAVAGVATAALLTAGAVEVQQVTSEVPSPATVQPATEPLSAHPEGRTKRVGEAKRKELAGAAASPAARPERAAAAESPAEEPAAPATGAGESAATGEPATESAAGDAPPQEAVIAEPEAPAGEGGTGRESNTGADGITGGVEPPPPTAPTQPSVPPPPAGDGDEPVGTQPTDTEGTATTPAPEPPTAEIASTSTAR